MRAVITVCQKEADFGADGTNNRADGCDRTTTI